MATGTTAEGTIWTTRPMSPEVEASYRCVHRGGTVRCDRPVVNADGECVTPRIPGLGYGGKPYSPATPKGSLSSGLPASVGEYLAVFETARRRLAGLEPWPIHVDIAPRLSKIAGAGDPKIRRAYREFIEAIERSGGVPSYQFVARPQKSKSAPQKTTRPAADVRTGQIWEDLARYSYIARRRIEILRVTNGYAVVRSTHKNAHTSRILLSRFRATSTGYRLVEHHAASRRRGRARAA